MYLALVMWHQKRKKCYSCRWPCGLRKGWISNALPHTRLARLVGATKFLLGLLDLGHYGRKFKKLPKNYEAFFVLLFWNVPIKVVFRMKMLIDSNLTKMFMDDYPTLCDLETKNTSQFWTKIGISGYCVGSECAPSLTFSLPLFPVLKHCTT